MAPPVRPPVRSHRDLLVWQRGIELVREVYRATEGLPASERHGLTSQIQRAAISVPANIAEGHGRPTTRDYLRFLSIACGSLRELDTYTELCLALEYGEAPRFHEIRQRSRELEKMLWGLRSALQKREGA